MNEELEEVGDNLEEMMQAEEAERPGFSDNFLRGLRASARNNASAYGYSVAITASFSIMAVATGTPTVPEIFGFAVGAVASVALVEAVASGTSGTSWRRNPAGLGHWPAPSASSPCTSRCSPRSSPGGS